MGKPFTSFAALDADGLDLLSYLASLPAEHFPHLVDVADHIAAGNADQRFELVLDFFVDGLAQRAI